MWLYLFLLLSPFLFFLLVWLAVWVGHIVWHRVVEERFPHLRHARSFRYPSAVRARDIHAHRYRRRASGAIPVVAPEGELLDTTELWARRN